MGTRIFEGLFCHVELINLYCWSKCPPNWRPNFFAELRLYRIGTVLEFWLAAYKRYTCFFGCYSCWGKANSTKEEITPWYCLHFPFRSYRGLGLVPAMFLFYLSACQSVVPRIGHDFYWNLSFPLLSCPLMNSLFYNYGTYLVSGSFSRFSRDFHRRNVREEIVVLFFFHELMYTNILAAIKLLWSINGGIWDSSKWFDVLEVSTFVYCEPFL